MHLLAQGEIKYNSPEIYSVMENWPHLIRGMWFDPEQPLFCLCINTIFFCLDRMKNMHRGGTYTIVLIGVMLRLCIFSQPGNT